MASHVPGTIALRGLRCSALQGDPPGSTRLVVDVSIDFDLAAVADSDSYDDVVDLADLAETVREDVAGPPRLLLETIAVHVARGVLRRYGMVDAVRVRVVKPEPPGLEADEECVELRLAR
jgi:dihydroneopterin aldolase